MSGPAKRRDRLTDLRPYVEPGLRQLRRLWVPFVTIQCLGLALVVAYFSVPGVERFFGRIADVKDRGGVPFNAAALAIACGVLPELFKSLTGVDRTVDRHRLTFLLHNVVVFAIIGSVQGIFYDGLAAAFGDSRRIGVIVAKTAVDQFAYSTLFTVPLICFSFTVRKQAYRIGPAMRAFGWRWYLSEAVPVLIVNWAYWWPMGLLMYTLPPKMTFVYGVIGSAASATLLTAIASQTAKEDALEGEAPTGR